LHSTVGVDRHPPNNNQQHDQQGGSAAREEDSGGHIIVRHPVLLIGLPRERRLPRYIAEALIVDLVRIAVEF
jgi:hypothetical protein